MSAADAVARLWLTFKPLVAARIALLQRYADGDSEVTVDEAASTAHKLAGALGSYGRHEGTRVAREIEVLLAHDGGDARQRLGEAVERLRDATET